MSIGETIKIYRREKGLTQSELAELIGVSMQAVSKWETNVGMPDISQIVPLSRVLEISTDRLLGNETDDAEKQVNRLKSQLSRINNISGLDRTKRIYDEAIKLFNKQPGMSDIALICLECCTELISLKEIDRADVLEECERYMHCILRYEKDADSICKAHSIMARAYRLLGKDEKSKDSLEKIPQIYGDRSYWEAENAFSDGNYELALKKVKESFTVKARFVSRCIRLAARSTAKSGKTDYAKECYELSEYMLRIINAFLSSGEYLPSRQVMQKCSVLHSLVEQAINLGEINKAKMYYNELIETKELYASFLRNPNGKHSLMFVEGDFHKAEKFDINVAEEIVKSAKSMIDKI